MGRIGQAVARRAQAFGLKIHYHDRRRMAAAAEEELHATYWESLDQMLARMDILDVLRDVLPTTGVILEIASGSGEHVVHFARNLPSLVFQPSDPEPDALLRVPLRT